MTDNGTNRQPHKIAGYQRLGDGPVVASCSCGQQWTGRNYAEARSRVGNHVYQLMGRPKRRGPKWRGSGMGQPAHVDIETTDTPIHKMGRK